MTISPVVVRRYKMRKPPRFPSRADDGLLRVDDVTGLLLSWRQGDAAALDRLVPLVYDELRRVARRHLQRELPGHALQATALVHEVYLRLVDVERLTLNSRTHFFAVAARLMRQILVDHARRQHADKRGGGATMMSLDDVSPPLSPPAWTCWPSIKRSRRWLQSTPGKATLSNCDSSRGSTSTRRLKHWGCRPPRSSENGLSLRPGSFGGCRRNSDAGRRSRDLSGRGRSPPSLIAPLSVDLMRICAAGLRSEFGTAGPPRAPASRVLADPANFSCEGDFSTAPV